MYFPEYHGNVRMDPNENQNSLYLPFLSLLPIVLWIDLSQRHSRIEEN
jgi:hypothetical protein